MGAGCVCEDTDYVGLVGRLAVLFVAVGLAVLVLVLDIFGVILGIVLGAILGIILGVIFGLVLGVVRGLFFVGGGVVLGRRVAIVVVVVAVFLSVGITMVVMFFVVATAGVLADDYVEPDGGADYSSSCPRRCCQYLEANRHRWPENIPGDVAGLGVGAVLMRAGVGPALDGSLPWLELGGAQAAGRRAGGAGERRGAQGGRAEEGHGRAAGRPIGAGGVMAGGGGSVKCGERCIRIIGTSRQDERHVMIAMTRVDC